MKFNNLKEVFEYLKQQVTNLNLVQPVYEEGDQVVNSRLCGDEQIVKGCNTDIICIDCSHSMSSWMGDFTRLGGAKLAVKKYLDQAVKSDPTRGVGIVGYADKAWLIAAPVGASASRNELVRKLDSLKESGNTNMGDALDLAVMYANPPGSKKRVILLTDGHANRGRDPKRAAIDLKAKGIQLDIIGVAAKPSEVNEPELKQMASVVNQELRYWFITNVGDLVERFVCLAIQPA